MMTTNPKAHLSPRERIRQITAENIANADRSHLEPRPEQSGYYSCVNWERQRIDALPRSTCSLLYVPDLPLDPFFTQTQETP